MATKTKTETKEKQDQATGAAIKNKGTRATEVREAIKELYSGVESNYLELAGLMSEAYHKDMFAEWGFASFKEYVQTELEVKYRKAMYFVEIWDAIKNLKIPAKQIKSLGWTRLKEIAAVANAENLSDLLDNAKKMTTREFTEYVKDFRPEGKERPKFTTMSFKMGEEEASVISDALAEAMKMTGQDSPALALELICQEWMEGKGSVPTAVKLSAMKKYMEDVYGVEVTVKKVEGKKSKQAEAVKKAEAEKAAKEKEKADAKKKKNKKAKDEEDDGDDKPTGKKVKKDAKKDSKKSGKAKEEEVDLDDDDDEEEKKPTSKKDKKKADAKKDSKKKKEEDEEEDDSDEEDDLDLEEEDDADDDDDGDDEDDGDEDDGDDDDDSDDSDDEEEDDSDDDDDSDEEEDDDDSDDDEEEDVNAALGIGKKDAKKDSKKEDKKESKKAPANKKKK